MLRDWVDDVISLEYLRWCYIVVTICYILELGSLGLVWLFLRGNDFSMFGFRALRRFGDARSEGQVGRLLGIFWMICGVTHCIHCRGCEVQGRGYWFGSWEKVSSKWLWVLLPGGSWLILRGLSLNRSHIGSWRTNSCRLIGVGIFLFGRCKIFECQMMLRWWHIGFVCACCLSLWGEGRRGA